jgi:hypothetical protein
MAGSLFASIKAVLSKFAVVDSVEVGRYLVYRRHSSTRSPRILRCGTPVLRVESLNLYSSPVCHTLLNAYEMRKKAAEW